jgi:hypothetical protein
VLSQWEVDDRATLLLMTRFYQNFLGKRPGLSAALPKSLALAEAQRWLRGLTLGEAADRLTELTGAAAPTKGSRATTRLYDHPHYWAGFILVGDPGDVSIPLPEPNQDEPAGSSPTTWAPIALWIAAGGLAAGVCLAAWRFRRRRAT